MHGVVVQRRTLTSCFRCKAESPPLVICFPCTQSTTDPDALGRRTMSSSQKIYRIMSFGHVVDMFESKSLFFASPRLWDDPFETFLIHARSNATFAQCWTKKAVSDAMWRIYSPDRLSVRVATTRASMTSALNAVQAEEESFRYLIKDVIYDTASNVRVSMIKLKDELDIKFVTTKAAEALLRKRDSFQHEDEVRVIVHDRSASDFGPVKNGLRVAFDAHANIDSVVFDPRVDETYMRVCEYYLRGSIGFEGGVGKSALYRSNESLEVKPRTRKK